MRQVPTWSFLAGDRSNECLSQQQQVLPATHPRAGRPGRRPGGVCEQATVQARPRIRRLHRRPDGAGCDPMPAPTTGCCYAFRAKGSVATESLVAAAATAVNAAMLDQSNAALATAAAAAVTASEAAVAADTLIGQEIWAYIPTMVFPASLQARRRVPRTSIAITSMAAPVHADICTSNCSTGAATWKTILVGGLGRGGRGYYALDITDPTSPKALWEFTDTNLGYSSRLPQIGKLADGTWVVLVSSGYNNIANRSRRRW